jgi:CSLREA domain-containing protein
MAGSAHAATTFTVGTADESSVGGDCTDTGNSNCSLREAISEANANPGADTIVFNSNLTGSTISLTSGALQITDAVSILGDDPSLLTIDAGLSSRIFVVNPTTPSDLVSIEGMTMANGDAGAGNGGAVYNNDSDLTLQDVVVSGSYATAVAALPGTGGGVATNTGALTITYSTVSGNHAYQGGGVASYAGELTITDSTVTRNYADGDTTANGHDGYGGGVWAKGPAATITGSTIDNNIAAYDGGGIYAVYNSGDALTIQNSTIADNHAASDDAGGVYDNGAANTLTVIDSTVTGNTAATDGGGLKAVQLNTDPVLQNSIVSGNTSGTDPDSDDLEASGYFDAYFSLIGVDGGYVNDVDGNLFGANPRLGPLQDNGGPTETMTLQCGSAAIDQGQLFNAIAEDQRGETRPFDVDGYPSAPGSDDSDIGAVEIQDQESPGTVCITKSPSGKNFGDQTVGTGSAAQTFTVTSIGPDPVNIASAALAGTDAAQFSKSSDGCSGTALDTDETCTIGVSFAPSSTGAKAAQLRLTDDAVDSPQNLNLTGNGVAVPPTPVAPANPTTPKKKKCKKKKHKRSAESAKKKCKKKKKKA